MMEKPLNSPEEQQQLQQVCTSIIHPSVHPSSIHPSTHPPITFFLGSSPRTLEDTLGPPEAGGGGASGGQRAASSGEDTFSYVSMSSGRVGSSSWRAPVLGLEYWRRTEGSKEAGAKERPRPRLVSLA